MQSTPVRLSEKFVTPIDGASVVASSDGDEKISWKHIAVSGRDGLSKVLKECGSSGIKVLCGQPQNLPLEPEHTGWQYVFVDLKPMNRILRHEAQDLVVSVQTGITLKELNDYLEPFGQWFPAVAGPDTTLLELINHGDAGLLEHGFGAIRDNVLGLEVVTGGGDAIKSGGIVVKNVTGYDTTKLFVGSRATLAIAHVAHLRLYARPQRSVTLLFQAKEQSELIELANDLIKADLSLVCCELIDLKALKTSAKLSKSLKQSSSDWQECGLLVRLSGHEELLKEIVPQVCNFKKLDAEKAEVQSSDADLLTEICSSARFPRLEVSVSISQSLELFKNWLKQNAGASFQYRPSTGRLSVTFGDVEKHNEMLLSFRKSNTFSGAPNTVASHPGPLEYRVETIGEVLKKRDHIKASLKDKFDPARCLNPLAVL